MLKVSVLVKGPATVLLMDKVIDAPVIAGPQFRTAKTTEVSCW